MLRSILPLTKPYLMYGLTEAFPRDLSAARASGSPAGFDRQGDPEFRSPGAARGWNTVRSERARGARTARRIGRHGLLERCGKNGGAVQASARARAGLVLPELAVFSGDTVRMDEEGFLYFIGRRDEMIKTSGYRVSPTEIEEVVYGTQLVAEVAAFGVPHPMLGQAIVIVATPKGQTCSRQEQLLLECSKRLPAYMVPAEVRCRTGPLPRNQNGKIDRKSLAASSKRCSRRSNHERTRARACRADADSPSSTTASSWAECRLAARAAGRLDPLLCL